MQVNIATPVQPHVAASVAAGPGSMVDPSFQVILPSGESSTWNISQNLTDRWGEINDYRAEHKPLQPLLEDPSLLERLVEQMWDEMTFVVRKDGQYGLLFEAEFCTKESEEDIVRGCAKDDQEFQSEMQNYLPESDMLQFLKSRLVQIAADFPSVQFCLPPKEEMVEHRLGLWAFIGDNQLTEDDRERLGRAILDIQFGK